MPPSVPLPRHVRTAIDASDTLSALLARRALAQALWQRAMPLLPGTLVSAVTLGSIDDEHWTLLADHAAAAAKLRQLIPTLEASLAPSSAEANLGRRRIVVKVRRVTQG